MNQRNTLLAGAAMGGLAVLVGAFGAHALKELLAATGRLDTYTLAVQYQFYHAITMVLVGALMACYDSRLLRLSALTFLIGIVFFCGSLYLLSTSGWRTWGAVTPIGGLFFIAGWVLLFLGIFRDKKKSHS